jgi:phospholipid/cholesterol/gamma-HCH transport system substrate-binding protein
MEISKNIKVGVFVLAGTGLLIIALYLIGDRQNFFGATFELQAKFKNINGLMPGNNVRYTGIDVGTVKKVEIIDDSTVQVIMVIEEKVQVFIKKNATANVGTDGLMGNKLINITSSDELAQSVEDGDIILSTNPIGTDAMMRTLDKSNNNIKDITEDIKKIASKLNKPNTLWSILMDTTVADNLKEAVLHINVTGKKTALIAGDLNTIINDVKLGKGTAGKLFTDTLFSYKLNQSMVNIKSISDSIMIISSEFKSVSKKINQGDGAIAALLNDTSITNNLHKSLLNLKNGAGGFSENMEALKQTWPFKKYFTKQKKSAKKI